MNDNKTVKELIEALSQYPDDAPCFAYEGEFIGIIVNVDGDGDYKDIPCPEWD